MSRRRDVFHEALGLPPKQRARLAHELIVSLDGNEPEDPAVVEREWGEVIARRVAELRNGTAKTEPWPKVQARIRRQLARRRASR